MELYEMLYRRMKSNSKLSELLAKYNGEPAIFYQRAATADDDKWGDMQYPRIDYTVDMQENPARNTSGILAMHVWCNTNYGAEPEDIENEVRICLHSTFAQADDDVYCFAWQRSDAFEVKTNEDESICTIGETLIFDIVACPCQYTMYPDPIKAVNMWTKSVIPTAIVVGVDCINGWASPTRENPIIYWRLASQGVERKQFVCTWLSVTIEGHVYAKTAADRLYNLSRLNTAHALAHHIVMEDTSPLFFKRFSVKPHLNYLVQGQIEANAYFGVLQTQKSLSRGSTGKNLINVYPFRREVAGTDDKEICLSNEKSEQFTIHYPMAGEAKSGEIPERNIDASVGTGEIETDSAGTGAFSFGYNYPTKDMHIEGE